MTKLLGIAMMFVWATLLGGLQIGCGDDASSCPGGNCSDGGADADADADSDGSCGSEDPAPLVAFVQPTDGTEVTGTQTVEVSVTDRCGIREATLALDGVTSRTWTGEPYTWVWDTSGLVSGNHILTASATDIAGQTASATIEIDVRAECRTATDCPPRVRIVYPTAGSHICGTLNVEATATGEGDIAQVEFQVDGSSLGTDDTAPYQAEWITTSLADGEHTLTATARDASGQEARHTESVVVDNSGGTCDNVPTAVITEPADASYVHGDVTVRVLASDDIGVIRVRTFVDAGMIWEDTTTPFEGVWHTDDFAEGPHLIRAEATDTAGQQSAEASLEVDVDRTPPTIMITNPSDGDTVSGTRTVTANATDNLGIQSVTFTTSGGMSDSFTDTEAPFEWPLDFPVASFCRTTVALRAQATDHASWTALDSVTVHLATPAETCNEEDDDCDGLIDEDFACRAGTTASCTTSCGSEGTWTCSATCAWETCVPPVETCNRADDDCDGSTDEDFPPDCCVRDNVCMWAGHLWECDPVTLTCYDPPAGDFCTPCATRSDCGDGGASSDDFCVHYPTGESGCSKDCVDDTDCPPGTMCTDTSGGWCATGESGCICTLPSGLCSTWSWT